MITKTQLVTMYVDQHMGIPTIAKNLGVGQTTVRNYLLKYEIPIRSVSQSLHGKKKTQEHCDKMSDAKKGAKNPNFGKRTNGTRCWYTLNNGEVVSMRSTWEVWYAEYLRAANISYEYEAVTYKLSDGSTYTPDFVLSDGTVVEVKGWLTAAHKSKLDRFQREHVDVKFVLANKGYLESLGIDLKRKWLSTKPTFQCDHCGSDYKRAYPSQRYCSITCRNRVVACNRNK